jgi:DNA (cytosine-5)-methyltransferase 1
VVVAENVRALVSVKADSYLEPCPWCLGDGDGRVTLRALGAVLGDLADIGFDAEWCGLRAADVGAPHGRFRVFILAWPHSDTASLRRRPERWDYGVRLEGLEPISTADANSLGHERCRSARYGWDGSADGGVDVIWGEFEPAVRQWERILGRAAPAPTAAGARGGQSLNPQFVEFMMGLPEGHVCDVPGLTRNEKLKALGNGVVPQQAEAVLRYLLNITASERAA